MIASTEERGLSTSTVRWAGVAGMIGGALFVVSAVVISSMPRGCIGDECAARPMRETGAVGALLMLALLLVVVGMAGLVILARNAGRLGALGKTGAVVAAVGAALPVIGGLVQGLLYGGDYPLMPYFVIPGILALVVGFVLLGIAVLLAGVLPRWAAVLLVVGSLAMLGFNDQNAQALLAIPNGIAWIAVGYVLWSGETARRDAGAR
jgi:hypothetical protein